MYNALCAWLDMVLILTLDENSVHRPMLIYRKHMHTTAN